LIARVSSLTERFFLITQTNLQTGVYCPIIAVLLLYNAAMVYFQGFQLITMLKPSSGPQIFGSSQTNQRYYLGSSPQVSHMSGLMRARPREEQAVSMNHSHRHSNATNRLSKIRI
jgi:hypothetical protein